MESCIKWAQTKSELPDTIKPKTFISSWDEHVLSWTSNDLQVPKLILKYEDLVYQKRDTINIIIKFFEEKFNINLNTNNKKIDNIIESTSFQNLKKLKKKGLDLKKQCQVFFSGKRINGKKN